MWDKYLGQVHTADVGVDTRHSSNDKKIRMSKSLPLNIKQELAEFHLFLLKNRAKNEILRHQPEKKGSNS